MAKYIDQSSGRLVQREAIDTSAGAGDADKLVATNGAGILADTIMNAATTGVGVVVKTNGSGFIADATLNASTTSAADKIVKLDGNGKIAAAMLPTGFGDDVESVVSFENLSAGDFVHVFDDAGTASVRKADAASGFEAHGFVLAAVTAPAAANVYFEGVNTAVSGQVAGRVYLSDDVAGQATDTPPVASGSIVQFIGVAVSATRINFEAGETIELA